jgi:polysaccharide export outer membrane protein
LVCALLRPNVQLLIIFAAFFSLITTVASADYLMSTGDVIEVSVYGAPDLRRRAALDIDGKLAMPFVGNVKLAGLSVSDARDKLRNLLVRNGIMGNPDVTVDIVEHRPFYVSGNVAKPGSYPYRPGVTARHAIALAGGLEVWRMRLNAGQPIEVVDLNNELATLRMEFVKQQARVKRLQAELEGKLGIDFGDLAAVPIPAALYADITELEVKHLEARLSNVAKEKASIEHARIHVMAQLAALERQQTVEEESLQQQTGDAAKVQSFYDRGVAPLSRVWDEHRSILLLKSRLSSTMAQVMNAKRTVEELGRQLEKIDETLRLECLKDLQEAALAVQKIRTHIRSVVEKLAYVGAPLNVMPLNRGGFQGVIHRNTEEKHIEIAADEETELVPGDVLEITLKRPTVSALPAESCSHEVRELTQIGK